MRDGVTIAYRGATYEIGRASSFYGIWVAADPRPQPLEWWPATPEGWYAAWARFTTIEVPSSIAPVPAPSRATRHVRERITGVALYPKRAGGAARCPRLPAGRHGAS